MICIKKEDTTHAGKTQPARRASPPTSAVLFRPREGEMREPDCIRRGMCKIYQMFEVMRVVF